MIQNTIHQLLYLKNYTTLMVQNISKHFEMMSRETFSTHFHNMNNIDKQFNNVYFSYKINIYKHINKANSWKHQTNR